MSAQKLRDAAIMLGTRADRAAAYGKWQRYGDSIDNGRGRIAAHVAPRDADLILAMQPDVAQALAQALDSLAFDRETNGEIDSRTWTELQTVADRILEAGK